MVSPTGQVVSYLTDNWTNLYHETLKSQTIRFSNYQRTVYKYCSVIATGDIITL